MQPPCLQAGLLEPHAPLGHGNWAGTARALPDLAAGPVQHSGVTPRRTGQLGPGRSLAPPEVLSARGLHSGWRSLPINPPDDG